jgi:hypothetical protein
VGVGVILYFGFLALNGVLGLVWVALWNLSVANVGVVI